MRLLRLLVVSSPLWLLALIVVLMLVMGAEGGCGDAPDPQHCVEALRP